VRAFAELRLTAGSSANKPTRHYACRTRSKRSSLKIAAG
jgi:hypothetical protein